MSGIVACAGGKPWTNSTSTVRSPINVVHADATGSFLILLAIAQQQGFFQKFGVDVKSIPARGATVPRLTNEIQIGLIGEPAAILQAAEGADLRIVASFSSTNVSGHLVARPEIKNAGGLRGKRLGVRVVGAGLWISTILALEQLGLNPQRDNITTLPIGSPTEIVRALKEGAIEGALVSVEQSRDLKDSGYSVLLDEYPTNISAFGGGLVVATSYLFSHPDVVENVMAALTEALAFSLAETSKADVMRVFECALGVTDPNTVSSNLGELKRKPYPSLASLKRMQSVMATHDARVLAVKIEDVIDDRLVRKLDENGMIAGLFAAHGAK